MATVALLRSIRCREVASAPFSAYNCLAVNAQPSMGSSYTGQNYASLVRAFGPNPVVNDIGTVLGSVNTSNAIREERKDSEAITQIFPSSWCWNIETHVLYTGGTELSKTPKL